MSFFNDHNPDEFAGDSNFFKFKQGENIFRLLTEPVHILTVFLGQGIKPLVVQSEEEIPEGKKGTHRFLAYVYSYADKCIQQAELPVSVINPISDFKKSSQYRFDGELPPYDILVSRKGEGKETTRYTVTPGRNEEPMPKEVLDELAQLPTCEDIKASRQKDSAPVGASRQDKIEEEEAPLDEVAPKKEPAPNSAAAQVAAEPEAPPAADDKKKA